MSQLDHMGKQPVSHLSFLLDGLLPISRDANELQQAWEGLCRRLDVVYAHHDRLLKRWGSHLIWKIDDYEQRLAAAKSGQQTVIFSPAFFTARHGYQMIASCALYGDGAGKLPVMCLTLATCAQLWPL